MFRATCALAAVVRRPSEGWSGDRYGTAHSFPRGSIWLFAVAACLPWSFLLPVLAWGRKRRASTVAMKPQQRRSLYLLLWALMPLLFFTVSGNVWWTYVLPGLPAMAMLAGGWLADHHRPRRVDWLVGIGLAMTAAAMGAFLSSQGRASMGKTAQPVTEQFQRCHVAGDALLFLGERSYSASFYTNGRAELVDSETDWRNGSLTAGHW